MANKKNTQYVQIYQFVRKNGSITPMQAFSELGITKLATRISEMTKNGDYSVKKTPITIDGTRYMKYSQIVKKRRPKNEESK